MRVGEREVAVEIERPEVPVRIVVDHELEERVGGADSRADGGAAPTALAAAHQARIDLLAGSRVARSLVDLLERVDLRRRQARARRLPCLAQQARRLERARARVVDHAVHYAVERVARRDGGVIDERERCAGKRYGWGPAECRLAAPYILHAVVDLREVGRAADVDAVVILGIA